jgi:hypothetical protein
VITDSLAMRLTKRLIAIVVGYVIIELQLYNTFDFCLSFPFLTVANPAIIE